jgi:uncharacterized protein (DUF1786 family)
MYDSVGTYDLSIYKSDVYEDGGFGGYIDEVGFWERVLTQPEITDLYNAGNGKPFPFD